MQAKSNKFILFSVTILALFLSGCGNSCCNKKTTPRKATPVVRVREV
jgi:hypothetical protein